MHQNYEVFDDIVDLDKDEELTEDKQPSLSNPPEKAFGFVGNHRILWVKNREIKMTLGPHWPFFLFMFGILLGGGLACLVCVAPKYPFSIIFLTIFITIVELAIYLMTALKNPGILLKYDRHKEDLENQTIKLCPKCGAAKSHHSYHCVDCNVCIEGYDHHCVWTGKCIGKGNLAYFQIFLVWTALYLCYCIFLTVFATKN